MNLMSVTQTELQIAVLDITHRSRLLAARPVPPTYDDWCDHRTESIAHLLDAIDRIEPGLGTRLMFALYPKSNRITDGCARKAA